MGTKIWPMAIQKNWRKLKQKFPRIPQITGFEGLKNESAKLIISQYHGGNIWLDEPIEINVKLIRRITSLQFPNKGQGIPTPSNTKEWIEQFIGVTNAMDSEGLVIRQVKNGQIKWACGIVALCLTDSCRASNIVLGMLTEISGTVKEGMVCNCPEHLANILKKNYK